MSSKAFKIIEAKSREHYGLCACLRTLVYVIEQKCPILEEFDALEDQCRHFLAYEGDTPVGTIRYRIMDDGSAKLERLVLVETARGKAYGQKLVQHIIDECKARGDIKAVIASAQDYIIPLYIKFGFEIIGEGFMEAGIAYHKVRLSLSP